MQTLMTTISHMNTLHPMMQLRSTINPPTSHHSSTTHPKPFLKQRTNSTGLNHLDQSAQQNPFKSFQKPTTTHPKPFLKHRINSAGLNHLDQSAQQNPFKSFQKPFTLKMKSNSTTLNTLRKVIVIPPASHPHHRNDILLKRQPTINLSLPQSNH